MEYDLEDHQVWGAEHRWSNFFGRTTPTPLREGKKKERKGKETKGNERRGKERKMDARVDKFRSRRAGN